MTYVRGLKHVCLQIYMLFHKSDEQLRSCSDKVPERNQVDVGLQSDRDSIRIARERTALVATGVQDDRANEKRLEIAVLWVPDSRTRWDAVFSIEGLVHSNERRGHDNLNVRVFDYANRNLGPNKRWERW